MKKSSERYQELEKTMEEIYKESIANIEKGISVNIPEDLKKLIDLFIEDIDNNKSLVQLIVTTMFKKMTSPEQDIRLHMAGFDGGYSARILDTNVTSHFFKNNFTRYANKETAFLTKATRSKIIWNFKDGKELPFQNKKIIEPFLKLIDEIENKSINSRDGICYIFEKMYLLSRENDKMFHSVMESSDFYNVININIIIEMLSEHFKSKLASRLPVIAIYSAYKQLMGVSKRYDGKKLLPLNVHTSSDKHGFGDIEIYKDDGTPFEIVEIKHDIPIDRYLILDIVKKSQNISIERYYILTTYKDSFPSAEEEKIINALILKTKKESGLEIIPNGIIGSLKYYLRFVEDYHEFLKTYTEELVTDAKNSTEVKDFHITEWERIMKEHGAS